MNGAIPAHYQWIENTGESEKVWRKKSHCWEMEESKIAWKHQGIRVMSDRYEDLGDMEMIDVPVVGQEP